MLPHFQTGINTQLMKYSPPSGAEFKNAQEYISTASYVLMVWCLVKHKMF